MITLEESANIPLYIQIYQQLKAKIINEHIISGHKLPSSRLLALTLNVSRNTVESAYQQLCAEGYIESRPCSGFFVAEFDKNILINNNDHLINNFSAFNASVNPTQTHYLYDFGIGKVDLNNFPFSIWNKLINKCCQEYEESLGSHTHPQGELGLRIQIAKYLLEHRGILCRPEQIVLGAGTQQCLSIICQLIQSHVNSIAMENPGYFGARVVFKNHNLQIVPISLEDDGIDISLLIKNNANVTYVTPSHQYPLGIVMPITKRVKLLDWADKNNALIIEDDYNSHFRYGTRPIPALQGISTSNRVIYLSSFTKSLLPTLRIAFIVLPLPLLNKFTDMFQHYQSSVPYLFQKTLESFMNLGYWDRHLRKMNQIYKKKHDLIIQTLEETMGESIAIHGKNAGLHVVINVNNNLSEQELIEKAATSGIKISPMSQHFMHPSSSKGSMVLLGFSGINQSEIIPGINLLRKAWFN